MEVCSRLCASLDGGGFEREMIHVYIWLSPFTVCLKLSQHCLLISYTPIQNKKDFFKKKKKKKEKNTGFLMPSPVTFTLHLVVLAPISFGEKM